MFADSVDRIVTQASMDAIVRKLAAQAKAGNIKATSLLLDRILGRVPLPIEQESDGPMEVVVRYETGGSTNPASGTEGDSRREESF